MHLIKIHRLMDVQFPQVVMNLTFAYSRRGNTPQFLLSKPPAQGLCVEQLLVKTEVKTLLNASAFSLFVAISLPVLVPTEDMLS